MSTTIAPSLLTSEDSIENAYHLFRASGEDGEINYFLDSDAEYEDYSIYFPPTAESFVHNALDSLESSTGIKFTASSWDDADWVIDMTDYYEDAGVSLEDWGSWTTTFKDPEDGPSTTFNNRDKVYINEEIGYTLGLNYLNASTQNRYTLDDSVMSAGWKGSSREFTSNDITALRSVWGEFIDLPEVTDNSPTPAPTTEPIPDFTLGKESAGAKTIVINNTIINETNNVTTTNIGNSGSGNVSVGNIGTVNNTTTIDNSFTIQTTNINLSVAITGDSKKSEKVEGTDGDDLIADGLGKDKLIGGEGADQFYFSGEEPFKKKTVDKIIDFDASEGDVIVIADEVIGDLAENPTLAIADTKKDLRELSKDGYDLLYFEPKGDLYVDGNGDSKGFGKKSEGGMIADLPNDTILTESDVLIGV